MGVYDKDFLKDDLIGSVELSLEDLVKYKSVERKILSLYRHGQIVISYNYMPSFINNSVKSQEKLPAIKIEGTGIEVKEKVHDTESFEPAEIVNTDQKHENIQTPVQDEEIIISTPYVREKKVETTEEINIDEKPNLKTKKENELKLIIHKVINLSNKDLIGKSDPYVFVQY